MDRNREARRSTMAATNGLSRRRHRTTSLRESPEEDVAVEFQETARLRDRGNGKKDRDRERDRLSRSKRRRADRLMHGSNREDVGEESSEESVNDEEEDEDEDCVGSVRMLPPNPSSMPSISNHRKNFPPVKTFRTAASWKAADEMIGVSVPRKARSASTKRSHDSWTPTPGVGGAELIHRQASMSPVRPSVGPVMASLAPASPSSSNASGRKKLKSNGPKLRPPKLTTKSSSAQDEIEIEIAEVLYGMMRQPQGPSKHESLVSESVRFDSRELNKAMTDAKSRVSSPISNSSSALPVPPLSILTQNSVSTITSISAIAPKRKRPRPVKYDDENASILSGRNGPIFSTTKPETDHTVKAEISSHNFKKSSGFLAENGRVAVNSASSQVTPALSEAQIEQIKPENNVLSDSNLLVAESNRKNLGVAKEEPQSPKNETSFPILNRNNPDEKISSKLHSSMVEFENQREEKFQIDLMAPPLRSSPERTGEIDFVAVDPKSMVTDAEMEMTKGKRKEDDKAAKAGKEDEVNVESKAKSEDTDSRNHFIINQENGVDLALDLEKTERDSGYGGLLSNNKPNRLAQKPQQPSISDKAGQANSLPLAMSVAGWPSGLPPMGYVAPLQGVLSMDGSSVTSTAIQPPNLLFPQPRPKRCATHCYIARNICYHQQIARINPFWPAAPGSASMFGPKHCNLNVLPSDFHGNFSGKSLNSVQEKAQVLPIFSAQSGKDNKPPQPAAIVDVSQRKQILVQQSLPPGAPNNILGPAFIFPLSQQQAAAAASVRPAGSVKSPTSGTVSSATSGSASVSGSATAAIAGPTMSFNYPNMPTSEAQYLAILQNNGYSFPIPAHVGAPPPGYRGAHPPAMPFFNGSFYSSQMIHPPPSGQAQPSQQGLQGSAMAGGNSSNQKHLQSQQTRSHPSGVYGGGNLQGFPSKNQQTRQLETDIGGEESPSTADSRVSRSNMGVYGQNFAMPIHSHNFALINSPVPIASGSEKKYSQQQGGSKTGVEPSQAFALSFASINGASTAPGIDLSTIGPNHPMFQNLPEVTRHGYQIMAAAAAAQVAQQKKSYQDGNTMGGGNSSNVEEERKTMAVKTPAPTMGQSIAFARTDLSDTSATIPGGTAMVDTSARRPSGSVIPSLISPANASNTQQQMQRNQQQLMLQKQQQFATAAAAAAARNKTSPTSNGSGVYSDHVPSPSSMAAKFPNALSSFSQNLVQSNSTSPAQSPQWKNSVRAATSQVPSQSISSTSSSTKTLPQQPIRPQQGHTQISFAANPKSSVQNQVQQAVSSQAPSPPLMAGSPTSSSISKSGGGSPRVGSPMPTGNKTGQASMSSSQQIKNSQPLPTQKSILGNPHVTSSSSSGGKNQLTQQQMQQQQQHLSKQHAQLFFSKPYMQAQASHPSSPSTASAASGYYLQRRGAEPRQAPPGQVPTSSGMLSLCSPISLDPAKPVAVGSAGSNVKTSGGLQSTAMLHHPAQFSTSQSPGNPPHVVPAGFPYIRAVSTAQAKATEQKQPTAGE